MSFTLFHSDYHYYSFVHYLLLLIPRFESRTPRLFLWMPIPLIRREAKKRAENIVEKAIKQGATCLLDGRGLIVDGYAYGDFVGPTIVLLNQDEFVRPNTTIDNVTYAEETVMTAPTLGDAIATKEDRNVNNPEDGINYISSFDGNNIRFHLF